MKYFIQIWETEECRDSGIAFNFYDVPEEDKEACMELARHMYWHQDFAAVEVIDENGAAVYHISNDAQDGEEL